MLLQLLTLTFFLLLSIYGGAQSQFEIKCTMTERQIMQSQSFSEDAPESEAALPVVKTFLSELELFYTKLNNGELEEINEHVEKINNAIQNANALHLNYSMFEEDIEIIQQYN